MEGCDGLAGRGPPLRSYFEASARAAPPATQGYAGQGTGWIPDLRRREGREWASPRFLAGHRNDRGGGGGVAMEGCDGLARGGPQVPPLILRGPQHERPHRPRATRRSPLHGERGPFYTTQRDGFRLGAGMTEKGAGIDHPTSRVDGPGMGRGGVGMTGEGPEAF